MNETVTQAHLDDTSTRVPRLGEETGLAHAVTIKPGDTSHRQGAFIALVVFLAAMIFPSVWDNDATIDAVANAMSYAALALGLNIVVGFAGLLDLGYAAFFAIGAYFYGIFTSYQVLPLWSSFWDPFAFVGLVEKINQGGPDLVHFTLSFWLALPLGAVTAAFFGVLFGAPTLRLRGDYLAIVTLGFGEIVPIVARNMEGITNGAAGMNGIQPPKLFGTSFGIDATPYYYVGVGLICFLIFASTRLRDSRVGRAWMAIREDETAAAAMGVNPVKYKLLAFAIGAAFAGMTGVYYVAKLQTATPEMFNFNVSTMLIVMVVLGGMGSVWGVVAGALLLQLLQSIFLPTLSRAMHDLGVSMGSEFLQNIDFVQYTQLVFGLLLIFMMLFRRDGLIPAVRRAPPLAFDEQHAEVARGGFANLDHVAQWGAPSALEVGRYGALRRPGGLEQDRHHGARRRCPRGDRPQRFGQVDAIQRDHRAGAGARLHRLRRARAARPQAAPDPRTGRRPHVPEHPPVPDADRARERHDRAARAAALGPVRLGAAHAPSGGGGT